MLNKNILAAIIFFSAVSVKAAQCQPGDRPGSNCSAIPSTADNGKGVQQSAGDAKKANDGGNMMGQLGTLIGAGFAAMNAPTCFGPPENTCPQFAMGLAGLAAGMMMSGDHGAAGEGAVDSGNAATVGAGGSSDATGSNLPTYGEMQKSIEGLKKQGVVVDTKKGTIGLPNGSVLSTGDAVNAGKLSAALGTSVSQDSINSGMKSIMTKAQERANGLMKDYAGTDSNTIDGGGGSRGGGGESYADTSTATTAVKSAALPERAPTAKITLKKQFGDSFIGDASENIFGMVNNRFKLKDSENSFITAVPSVNK